MKLDRSLSVSLTTGFLFALVVSSTAVEASTCERWQNKLDPCSVLPQPGCQNSQLTATQIKTWFNFLYADTAGDACSKYWLKYEDFDGLTKVEPTTGGDPDLWNCYMDGNDDGTISPADKDQYHTTVWLETVTRDTCCDENVVGPYWELDPLQAADQTEDWKFTPEQIQKIRQLNLERNNNVYKSDAGKRGAPPAEHVGIDVNILNPSNPSTMPEVDHLIPRKDSKGCLCGRNTFANAVLVSHTLNRSMGNMCLDKSIPWSQLPGAARNRRTLINAYTANP